MTRSVVVLGATGSIGRSALDVVAHLPERLSLHAIAAGSDWQGLRDLALKHRPRAAALANPEAAACLEGALAGSGVRVLAGEAGLLELAADPAADCVVQGVTGAAGLPYSLAAIRAGHTLALANKESMVMAGALMRREAEQHGAEVLPVDSEHSAIFQALAAGRREDVRRVILTASGGPFRGRTRDDLETVTPEDALKHPTWDMGPKISIDSATLMNKALEIVEARWLFDVAADDIDVVVHPQSVVHSMVEFRDGSIVAQMGEPDMKLPIQLALTWPERAEGMLPPFDLARARTLEFEPPDRETFPALDLGFRAAREGGTSGSVLNAANEAAVAAFLEGRIRFPQIAESVGAVMDRHDNQQDPGVADVLSADAWAREEFNTWLS